MATHFELIAYTHGKDRGVVIGEPLVSFQEARDSAVPFMQAMRQCIREHVVDRIAVREVSTFETEINIPDAPPAADSLLEG